MVLEQGVPPPPKKKEVDSAVLWFCHTPTHCERTFQCKGKCNKTETEAETSEEFTGNAFNMHAFDYATLDCT